VTHPGRVGLGCCAGSGNSGTAAWPVALQHQLASHGSARNRLESRRGRHPKYHARQQARRARCGQRFRDRLRVNLDLSDQLLQHHSPLAGVFALRGGRRRVFKDAVLQAIRFLDPSFASQRIDPSRYSNRSPGFAGQYTGMSTPAFLRSATKSRNLSSWFPRCIGNSTLGFRR